MSYIIIRIFSFECDHPSCGHFIEAGQPYLADAVKEITEPNAGWTVTKRPGSKHFCPEHRPAQ